MYGPTPEQLLAHLWSDLAYAARYGHQPLPVLMALSRKRLQSLMKALSQIVTKENEAGAVPGRE